MSDAGQAGGPASEGGSLGLDERAELERLRAEVTRLHTDRAAPARRPHVGWRSPVAVVLIVVGCLLAPVSVLAVWTANQVSSTSRYVANVEPLVHDPAVQNALTDKLTTEITTHLNVTARTDQAASLLTSHGLPRVGALLQTFGPSISSAVTGFIHGQVHKIVTSPQFAHVWVQANTAVHQQLVKALSGQGGSAVSVSNGQVVLSLGPFINLIKQDLVKRGFTIVSKLPAINPTLSLFSAKYLVKAQTGYRLINDLKIVLPIVAVLFLAIGVYVARSHRRALIGAGLGLAASMLVLGAGLLIFRGVYLNSVPNDSAAGRRGRQPVRHDGPVHQGGAAYDPGRRPGHRRWRVPDRALGERGHHPESHHVGPGLGPAERRARGPADRPRRIVDLRAPQGAADLGRGPRRAVVRLRRAAERGSRHRDRRRAAGRAGADRTARQQAACPASDLMILQAAGLAVLAAISPTALLVAAVYLGSARPRLVGTLYLAGAIIMSLVMGLVVIAILRNTGLSHRSAHTPRYGLRLGLGIVLLAAGAAAARRKPKLPDPDKKQGLVSRMIADPAPASAFAVGLLLFAPGLTFIAALQVIATANADIEYTTVAIVLVVIINAAFVWLPLLLHLIAPGMTTQRLTAFNGWLRANGNKILIGVLLAGGAIMVGNGIFGLAGG